MSCQNELVENKESSQFGIIYTISLSEDSAEESESDSSSELASGMSSRPSGLALRTTSKLLDEYLSYDSYDSYDLIR